MKTKQWLAISKSGIQRIRKSKPDLEWDEIAIQVTLDIPDELFERPIIDAKIEVKDVPNNVYDPSVILNTKELIEQQTGAKISMEVHHVTEED
jgi:hypothetical protein